MTVALLQPANSQNQWPFQEAFAGLAISADTSWRCSVAASINRQFDSVLAGASVIARKAPPGAQANAACRSTVILCRFLSPARFATTIACRCPAAAAGMQVAANEPSADGNGRVSAGQR